MKKKNTNGETIEAENKTAKRRRFSTNWSGGKLGESSNPQVVELQVERRQPELYVLMNWVH